MDDLRYSPQVIHFLLNSIYLTELERRILR